MKLKSTLAAMALLAGLSSGAAYADSLNLTLVNPNGGVPAGTGGTVTYDATVSAPSTNGAAIFLNGDSLNVTSPATYDDSDFFANFPLSLAPGASFTGDLFTITLPANTAFGTYLGSFTLQGGSNGAAIDALATVNFSVAATPEPSSILLLLTGMGGLGLAVRRRMGAGTSAY